MSNKNVSLRDVMDRTAAKADTGKTKINVAECKRCIKAFIDVIKSMPLQQRIGFVFKIFLK